MKFKIGQTIRYTPGTGTYGFEDSIKADGFVYGIVIGFSPTRVRVELQLGGQRSGSTVTRCVDAESLR